MPQIGGMYRGDRSRKETLVDVGFRLPSALDNRPLHFEEFLERVRRPSTSRRRPGLRAPQGDEHRRADHPPDRPGRPGDRAAAGAGPGGRPARGDPRRDAARERVLVTTLTKKMAEDLTEYLHESGVKVRYLHSDIETLERIEIMRDCGSASRRARRREPPARGPRPPRGLARRHPRRRQGRLPAGQTALVQTIGRAARNINGRVVMYADTMTESIRGALDETNRRRARSSSTTTENGITPETMSRACPTSPSSSPRIAARCPLGGGAAKRTMRA